MGDVGVDLDVDGDDDGGDGVQSLRVVIPTLIRLQMMVWTQLTGWYLNKPATRNLQASVNVFEDLHLVD